MADRIADTFQRTHSVGRAAFVAYVCAGDPDFETCSSLCRELLEGGTDVLELGVPFSDPLADGLVNQLAAQRALESGMTHAKCFDLVREIRTYSQAPVIFYTYYNLIHAMGIESYVETAVDAGVDGILALDCPPEEAGEFKEACDKKGLKNIFLVAPTTPPERIAKIAASASGFIYYVSRLGVTGERSDVAGGIKEAVARIHEHTDLPVCVGFGVSSPEHVKNVGNSADGVIVGSALVNVVAENIDDKSTIPSKMREKLDWLLGK